MPTTSSPMDSRLRLSLTAVFVAMSCSEITSQTTWSVLIATATIRWMNLWEANVLEGGGAYFEMDGYFGSGSHQTLLRNSIGDSWAPVYFKRWSTYMNLVGNVLGQSGGGYSAYLKRGAMAIGTRSFRLDTRTSAMACCVAGTVAWNFPLNPYPSADSAGAGLFHAGSHVHQQSRPDHQSRGGLFQHRVRDEAILLVYRRFNLRPLEYQSLLSDQRGADLSDRRWNSH